MNIKQHVPNALTSCNILCGSIAVMIAFSGKAPLAYVSFLVIAGAVFDFLDGFAARLLKAYSPMGKELDSLADLITFGLAPTAIVYSYMKQAIVTENYSQTSALLNIAFIMSPFLLVVFSALRLAKFNIDTRQTESFIGMPTPANALLIISFPLILAYNSNEVYHSILANKFILLGLIISQCYFLVSEIPMFSLKFKKLSLSSNKIRFSFLFATVAFLSFFGFAGITLSILLYLLISIVSAIVANSKTKS